MLFVPQDVIEPDWDETMVPEFFELQVKTLFQHAWSQAEHPVGYNPGEVPLELGDARHLAFASAQAWGADRVFDELFRKREN